jgi:hypothetical protein
LERRLKHLDQITNAVDGFALLDRLDRREEVATITSRSLLLDCWDDEAQEEVFDNRATYTLNVLGDDCPPRTVHACTLSRNFLREGPDPNLPVELGLFNGHT